MRYNVNCLLEAIKCAVKKMRHTEDFSSKFSAFSFFVGVPTLLQNGRNELLCVPFSGSNSTRGDQSEANSGLS